MLYFSLFAKLAEINGETKLLCSVFLPKWVLRIN